MSKNIGLGKGLGALISDYDTDLSAYDKNGDLNKGVNEIDLSLIDPNPDQPRRSFDETALRELALSISNYGVIQPIIVAERGERYVIIAGERRYRAARMAKINKIPAIVSKASEQEQKEIMIIENLQREDLNPIEEAQGLATLIKDYNVKQEVLAQRLGKSRPSISNALRLLNLPAYIQKMVKENKLTAGHARCLVSVKDPEKQRKLALASAENKLTVRQLEMEVNGLIAQTKNKTSKKPSDISPEMKTFVDKMQRTFSTKVKISGDNNKGKITIDYYTADDLDRIYKIINKLKG